MKVEWFVCWKWIAEEERKCAEVAVQFGSEQHLQKRCVCSHPAAAPFVHAVSEMHSHTQSSINLHLHCSHLSLKHCLSVTNCCDDETFDARAQMRGNQ